jgi:hypothetical protein
MVAIIIIASQKGLSILPVKQIKSLKKLKSAVKK